MMDPKNLRSLLYGEEGDCASNGGLSLSTGRVNSDQINHNGNNNVVPNT